MDNLCILKLLKVKLQRYVVLKKLLKSDDWSWNHPPLGLNSVIMYIVLRMFYNKSIASNQT